MSTITKKKSKNTKKYPVGVKINFLTIQEYLSESAPYKVLCKCECGRIKQFYLSNIIPKKKARYTVSCGCKRSGIVSTKVSTHAMSKTKFYKRWRSMFDRCSPKYICAKDYVGVRICKRWSKFKNFKEDMYESYLRHREEFGERQTTLDRKNPYGNYEPKNCRWATFSEQSKNIKKNYKPV